MKVKLELDLESEDSNDVFDFKLINQRWAMAKYVWGVRDWCRSRSKHGDLDEKQYELLEDLENMLGELDYVDLDD